MATSVRKAKRVKQSFEFVESVPEKDVIQVLTPPQDGISETIHETMLASVRANFSYKAILLGHPIAAVPFSYCDDF